MRKLIIALILTLTLVPVAAQDTDLIDVTVFMPFVPNIQFAPVYVAMEKGYFAEAGLNVTLEYGSEPDGLDRLALGDIDYAFVGGEQVLIARANAREVVYVYEWYQRNPIAIVVPVIDDIAPITGPPDLARRDIGVPGRFGATYSSFVGLLTAFDLTENDINLQEIGFNAPEVICVGGVEAAAVYINNEPLQIRNRALAGDCGDVTNIEVIAIADYVDLVSNGIAVSDEKLVNDPEQIEAFVTAFERGMVDTMRNPLEAYTLSTVHIETLPFENETVFTDLSNATNLFLETNPPAQEIADRRDLLIAQTRTFLTADELLQVEILVETIRLWEAETLGETDPESWAVTQETLMFVGFIEEPIEVETAFTNEFVPGLFD